MSIAFFEMHQKKWINDGGGKDRVIKNNSVKMVYEGCRYRGVHKILSTLLF